MTNALATRNGSADAVAMERLVVQGDLSALNAEERVGYYNAVCKSVGLNPLTKPFDYLKLNGKTVLYPRKEAVEQLRKIHGVSLRIAKRETVEGLYIVTVQASDREGRVDEAIGALSIKGLSGESLANALMKAETKAKRRATLSLVGLWYLEESGVGESSPDPFISADDTAASDDIEEAEIVPDEPTLERREWPARPFDAKTCREALRLKAERDTRPAGEDFQTAAAMAFSNMKIRAEGRHKIMNYVFGLESLKDATTGQCGAFIKWADAKPVVEEEGAKPVYVPCPESLVEAAAIIATYDATPRDVGIDGCDQNGDPLPSTALFDDEGGAIGTGEARA